MDPDPDLAKMLDPDPYWINPDPQLWFKHINLQERKRPWSCSHCEAGYDKESMLRYHVEKVHLNMAHYVCQVAAFLGWEAAILSLAPVAAILLNTVVSLNHGIFLLKILLKI
jgi:hypothetical protein